jgi:adenine-specific DNA-methyltransferase
MLIQGDNLDALKALLPFYAGRVKCIYIDPPYNTRSAFEHYDDNLEHTQWLSMMWPRLELLRELLAEDGSIWVSIDDNEGHYLKVVMDEVFGRGRFLITNLWQKRYSRENREAIGDSHDFILMYAMSPDTFKSKRNLLPLGQRQRSLYRNPDNDPRGPW